MKLLTNEEYLNAPYKVKYLHEMSLMGFPVGASVFEECVRDYPEYFPDEVKYKKKWSRIPQEVHDKYIKERIALSAECYKDVPQSKGIFYWSQNPEEYKEWESAWNKARENAIPLQKELYEKHYKKYGFEWDGL